MIRWPRRNFPWASLFGRGTAPVLWQVTQTRVVTQIRTWVVPQTRRPTADLVALACGPSQWSSRQKLHHSRPDRSSWALGTKKGAASPQIIHGGCNFDANFLWRCHGGGFQFERRSCSDGAYRSRRFTSDVREVRCVRRRAIFSLSVCTTALTAVDSALAGRPRAAPLLPRSAYGDASVRAGASKCFDFAACGAGKARRAARANGTRARHLPRPAGRAQRHAAQRSR